MLKLKTFLKKTRRGKVLKIVREHYLRDDIGCGSELCEDCQDSDENDDVNMEVDGNSSSKTSKFSQLSETPKSVSSVYKDPHYLVLDTNIILNQMDVLEVDFYLIFQVNEYF
jgi:exosome complex exonuclease DIS3/RRP44